MGNNCFPFFYYICFMREVLYKNEYVRYESVRHRDTNPINYLYNESLNDDNDIFSLHHRKPSATQKHPLFQHDVTFKDEETFVENFGNPMWSISKDYFMVVVEKDGDKVAIKTFSGGIHRRAGVQWFKKYKNMDFISVNIKTGDVYVGDMVNYHLKKKCKKRIRRNYFNGEPLNIMMSKIKNNLRTEDCGVAAIDAISIFMNEIDHSNNFGELTFSQRLFKFYISKRGVKYSNNFHVFIESWYGPGIRKCLKKNDNRMIDALMSYYGISGKQVKKALHNCEYFNVQVYKTAREIFGDDWLNQDENLILECLNLKNGIATPPQEFYDFISNEELKRVFKLFKQVIVNKTLDSYTFYDHIRIYTELKSFGETDLKWMSSDDSKSKFREEHLDWADKLEHYRQGNYTRIYPDYSYELIQKPISIGDDVYYPVLLDDSHNYNKESTQQSNCVKTYIGKCSSIIVSVRKNNIDSDERATIEYQLTKSSGKLNIERVQSLGRFNSRLNEEWNEILFKLDQIMLYYIEDEKFDTVQIKKKCKNGVELNSTSDWNDNGRLFWTQNKINKSEGYNNFLDNYF
jgi:hypothetical protein